MVRLAGVCALLASVLSYSPAPAEGATTHLKIKGRAALATFMTTDPPCLETVVNISASEEMVKESPGEEATIVGILLVMTQINVCTGIPLFVGDGSTSDQVFHIPNHLRSATLTATVPVVDAGNTHEFDVDLTWTATGRAVREHLHEIFRDRDAGIFIHSQFCGVHAPAEATGTIFGLGQNFTPEPSISAELLKQSAGVVTVDLS